MNLRYANGALGIADSRELDDEICRDRTYSIRYKNGKNISKNIPELEQLFAPVKMQQQN